MTYISPIAPSAINQTSRMAICPLHAAEASQILLATSPRHASRFARAMHRRVSGDWMSI